MLHLRHQFFSFILLSDVRHAVAFSPMAFTAACMQAISALPIPWQLQHLQQQRLKAQGRSPKATPTASWFPVECAQQ
jgi:hypothetical protein